MKVVSVSAQMSIRDRSTELMGKRDDESADLRGNPGFVCSRWGGKQSKAVGYGETCGCDIMRYCRIAILAKEVSVRSRSEECSDQEHSLGVILLPSHGMLYLLQGRHDLLIVIAPADDLQAHRCILVFVRMIHIVDEFILIVYGRVGGVWLVLLWVDGGDREDHSRIIK